MKKNDHFPILDISEFQDELQTSGSFHYHEIQGKRVIEKPHKHDFFVFLLFEKGSGTHSIDFVNHNIKDYQVHLLFPDQVHKWNLGRSTSAYQLMISKPIFELVSSSLNFSFILYQNHPVIDLSTSTFQNLLYEFKSIKDELHINPIHWDIITLRSSVIARMVSREAEHKFKDMMVYHANPLLFKYHSLVDTHFKTQKSVAFYAEQLHISPNYLNILCKKHFHVPALSLIQNRIALEARRLLRASDRSIKEITYLLGFNDPAYFSNFFKSQTGFSPRQFRSQL